MTIKAYPSTAMIRRFWAKVDRSGGDRACWVWTASRYRNGYGQFGQWPHSAVLAHRFAYETLVGQIPEGLVIDHLCRNRLCVNPEHLEPVTTRTNNLRGASFAAVNAAKTHCIHGHPLDGDNLYIHPKNGRRQCRACRQDARRKSSVAITADPERRAERAAYLREYRAKKKAAGQS